MVSKSEIKDKIICIVGLGYVGLPLAEAFSHHFQVIGFDTDKKKIEDLSKQYSTFELTTNPLKIKKADIVIIAVPTPVTRFKEPDLSYVRSASRIVGENLKKNAIVVLESTVYPGVTEEIAETILEKKSGLTLGSGFKIGYSPERVNPGDHDHDVDKIVKIVAGMDAESTEILAAIYGTITTVYRTSDIKTAEAAKVIENIQRDLNIALMNELSLIFHRMGLDTNAVLDAAATKWNFHRYSPGLVGGHCIPVDPYYLVYKAKEFGYHPRVILAGRSVNDSMSKHVASLAIRGLNSVGKVIKGSKVLIMGLTYKENVPDTRETPVVHMIKELQDFGVDVYGYDPVLSKEQMRTFNITVLDELSIQVDCIIIAALHDEFKDMTVTDFKNIMDDKPVFIDVRGSFPDFKDAGFCYYKL